MRQLHVGDADGFQLGVRYGNMIATLHPSPHEKSALSRRAPPLTLFVQFTLTI